MKEWMPHGMCFGWEPAILWLRVISDAVIALAYFSIPTALFYFVRQRPDFRLYAVLSAFALFIVACGITHIMDIVTIWVPWYGADAVVRLGCAFVSIVTAVALWWAMPAFRKMWKA